MVLRNRRGQVSPRVKTGTTVDVGAAWTSITVLWLCTPNLSKVITRLETGCLSVQHNRTKLTEGGNLPKSVSAEHCM